MSSVTILDIANNLGTSVATVSRALNGRSRVSAETRSKVMQEARRLGYKPKMGVPLRTVGLMTCPPDEYIVHVNSTMAQVLSERGWVVETFLPRNAEEVLKRFLDGVVIMVAPEDIGIPEETLRLFPSIRFNWPGDKNVHGVVSDHVESGYLGARELLEAGHRRIAVITCPRPHWAVCDRLEGVRRAFAEFGAGFDESLLFVADNDSLPEAIDNAVGAAATALFALGEVPTPMVVSRLLGKWRLRIPEDISVIGFQLREQAQHYFPPLTGIRQPIEQMAQKVGELLDVCSRNNEATPMTLVFGNELVQGGSVAPPRA